MLISDFFKSNKPVGAICHGVVLACRSRDTETQKSVLWNRKTTALLSSQELLAWRLTRLWLGDYYRTYEQTVEDEVIKSLSSKSDFLHGPAPLLRDDPAHLSRGYVVIDRNYISARWPGDAHRFAQEFVKIL
jgi:protease I